MKEFWVRLISVAAIVIALLGYNSVLELRAKEDEIARLDARLKTAELTGNLAKEGEGEVSYRDGTFTGEAQGFGGPISVEVRIESGRIEEIQVVSAKQEDGAYLATAKDVIPVILEKQSAEVDAISGATFSSTGIRDAVAEALGTAIQ
ncbi:FMN-binding protein [Roseburia hominis]